MGETITMETMLTVTHVIVVLTLVPTSVPSVKTVEAIILYKRTPQDAESKTNDGDEVNSRFFNSNCQVNCNTCYCSNNNCRNQCNKCQNSGFGNNNNGNYVNCN